MDDVLRQEHKFLLTQTEAYRIQWKIGSVLKADSHNGSNGYLVRSLYFDTPDERDFTQKMDSIETRRKIRLRIYSPDAEYAKLEIKQKQGADQRKRSLVLTKKEAQSLVAGDFSILLSHKEPYAAEIYSLMEMFCYRPKVIIDYNRKAFIRPENSTRITFDSDVRSTESSFNLFSDPIPMNHVLPAFQQILEVKYNHFLLSYIKDILGIVDRNAVTCSKYALARQVTLGYNP